MELVHLDVADGVATITLDSEHNRNALSAQLVRELGERLDAADADDAARAVVLRSAHRVFCSGADLSEAASAATPDGPRAMIALQRRVAALSKPVVVVLAGPVRAGGLGLVASADVVLAAASVTFALTEVRLGVAPAVISAAILERVGDRAAADLFLTARSFDAAEAASIGLITRAVPDDALDDAVAQVVADLAAGDPQGLRETKRLLSRRLVDRLDADGDALAELSTRLFSSEAAQAAMLRFLESRRR